MDSPNIARVAAVIGDNARAQMLVALMAGRALTATELAACAGITKQTASSHLAKLTDTGLITVLVQGRHRYFRLAGHGVAEIVESLMGVAASAIPGTQAFGPREPALRKARVCYDHLAGELGVFACEGLLRQNVLLQEGGSLRLAGCGAEWFVRLGIDVGLVAAQKRSFCRTCMDWSERRPHLAGALGAAVLQRVSDLGWARVVKNSRVVAFTVAGERAFRDTFSAKP